MANAAERLLKVIKGTNTDTQSDLVSLTVKSVHPLQMSMGDKVIITSEFIVFDSYILTDRICVGDKFKAISLSDDQKYYIVDIISSTYELDKYIAGGHGTDDYNDLSNKPKINNVTLSGNKTTSDLGIVIPTKTSDLTNDSGFLVAADISGKEDKSNKVTSISSSSTDDQYSSAKAVYSYAPPKAHASTATTYGVGTTTKYGHCMTINDLNLSAHANGKALSAYQGYVLDQAKEDKSNKVTSINSSSTDTQYPSAKLLYDQLALKINTTDMTALTTSEVDTIFDFTISNS